jgi:hypothetical protein
MGNGVENKQTGVKDIGGGVLGLECEGGKTG